MGQWSKKFLNRWADIFIHKMRTEGRDAAHEWANRMFSAELMKELIPIVMSKNTQK